MPEDLGRVLKTVPSRPCGREPRAPGSGRSSLTGDYASWYYVATSLDGRALLLGEVEWRDEPVTRDDLLRTCSELMRKGVPAIHGIRDDVSVVRAVFVPDIAGRRSALPDDCRLVLAADVVEALG